MTSYKPPINENLFLIHDVLEAAERTKDIAAFSTLDAELLRNMIDAAGLYAVNIAHPLNKKGDEQGCTYDPATKQVKTPDGFKAAFDEWAAMGMIGLEGSPEYGGMGVPNYVAGVISEFNSGSNFSLAAYPGLTGGAAKVLESFASEEVKKTFLEKFYTGKWTATMCLTEPNSGSDLSGITTKAIKNTDGTHSISGGKIFITSGEHDLADNICHLVLARLPDAPPGIKGISLFLVPKKDIDTGAANGVSCGNIEHKMGIKGSATCSINFENAKGYLIGKENEGMKAMFTMMNDARANVARQGLSMAEVAWQNAVEYARVRVQGKALSQSFNPKAAPVTIINHASVKRDLMEIKAQIDGWRALLVESSIQLDLAGHHPDPAVRKAADDFASLLTPVLKAGLTDFGCRATEKCIQIHGGMGYISETGVEQYYRDTLISTIYEGTNDIQAMDFTFRKVLDPQNPQRAMNAIKVLQDIIQNAKSSDSAIVGNALGACMQAAQVIGKIAGEVAAGKRKPEDIDEVGIAARDFTELFGKVAVGAMWLKIMDAAKAKMAADPSAKDFCEMKLNLGDIYLKRIMAPDVARLVSRITADNARPIRNTPESYFDI